MPKRQEPCDPTGLSRPALLVRKVHAYPISETLAALKASMPDLLALVPGDRVFVPSLDQREDRLIKREAAKANRQTSGRFLLPLLEYRSHIRGRLIICAKEERRPIWMALLREMEFMIRVNRMSPPLDKRGNALVPYLPQT